MRDELELFDCQKYANDSTPKLLPETMATSSSVLGNSAQEANETVKQFNLKTLFVQYAFNGRFAAELKTQKYLKPQRNSTLLSLPLNRCGCHISHVSFLLGLPPLTDLIVPHTVSPNGFSTPPT